MYWEVAVLKWLEESRNIFWTSIMESITFLAESIFLVVLIAALYWCVDKKKAARLGWVLLGSGTINGVLKNIFRAPRPFTKGVITPLRIETATSYSFPSGHTQSATSFWTMFYKMTCSRTIGWVAVIMILLTAVSRLYLGVHWPVDVIAAIVVGIISVTILDLLYDVKVGFTKWHILGVSCLIFIFTIIPVDEDLCKVIGALWGLVLGGYYEQQFIKFQNKGTWKQQLMKMLIGGIGLVSIYLTLGQILPEYSMMDMIKYALVLLWVSAGAPLLFKILIK